MIDSPRIIILFFSRLDWGQTWDGVSVMGFFFIGFDKRADPCRALGLKAVSPSVCIRDYLHIRPA